MISSQKRLTSMLLGTLLQQLVWGHATSFSNDIHGNPASNSFSIWAGDTSNLSSDINAWDTCVFDIDINGCLFWCRIWLCSIWIPLEKAISSMFTSLRLLLPGIMPFYSIWACHREAQNDCWHPTTSTCEVLLSMHMHIVFQSLTRQNKKKRMAID